MRKKIYWVKIPLSPAELESIQKKFPRELNGPGTYWASIRQKLGLSIQPVGFNNIQFEHIQVMYPLPKE